MEKQFDFYSVTLTEISLHFDLAAKNNKIAAVANNIIRLVSKVNSEPIVGISPSEGVYPLFYLR